ncbi:MAG: 1-phosphofructokinase family hexose kinase [Ruminococcaceae bacterium]|nr:1-phosphofructokinase family hexose kinase [Oscillospiraceae bacterium]
MIVTITLNPSFDKSIIVCNFHQGCVNKITGTRLDAGGKGVNVSKVLGVLDSENIAVGIAGRNNYDSYSSILDSIGVNHDFILTDGSIRTNIKINDPVSGTTTDINEAGIPINEAAAAQLINKLTSFDKETVFVISGSISPITSPQIISRLISTVSGKVIVDTSGEALKEAVKVKPYIAKPNIQELSELTGRSFTSLEEIIISAKELVSEGLHGVMVTLGDKGLIYVTAKSVYHSPVIKVNAKCTVGAGDAVTAGIAYCLKHGAEDKDFAKLGAALGTSAVMTDGSQAPCIASINHYMDLVQVTEL